MKVLLKIILNAFLKLKFCWYQILLIYIVSSGLDFRLVGGTNNSNGRVEVFYNGTWGTICDDGWTTVNTLIVCKLLNFV